MLCSSLQGADQQLHPACTPMCLGPAALLASLPLRLAADRALLLRSATPWAGCWPPAAPPSHAALQTSAGEWLVRGGAAAASAAALPL
jgi:hypothetical protein